MATNYTGMLFAGTGLTLTCTVTVDPTVDSNKDVILVWSGPRDIPGERYLVLMAANESDDSYTSNLIISPLAEEHDDGDYTCTVTISGGNYVLESIASDNISINALGKCCVHSILYCN